MPKSDKIVQLRQVLEEKFRCTGPGREEFYRTGVPVLDSHGIPRGGLTELVSGASSLQGQGLILYGVLEAALQRGDRVILIDGRDAFAPTELPEVCLDRLVWVRCQQALEGIKAADLAIRDGNVPLVLVFFSLNDPRELRRIPATAWHRLQLLAEKSSVTALIFSPQPQVGCARLRLSLQSSLPLSRLHADREDLFSFLSVGIDRQRRSPMTPTVPSSDHEEICRAVCA